jgi:hypothetical protein
VTIWVACGLALACLLFFHAYEIFNFTLSIDEELNTGGENVIAYLQHGRWGQALRVILLMSDSTVPVTPIATGLVLYGAAFVLLIRKFKVQHWTAVAVAAPLFFGFPTLPHAIGFANIALTLGLGAFLCVLALYAADTPRPSRLMLAVVLITLAVALYQSLLFLAIVFFAADLLVRIWPPERFDAPMRRRLLWYVGILLAATALYILIALISLNVLDLNLAYVTQFWNPDDLGGGIGATLIEAGKLYGSAAPAFLDHGAYYLILVTFCGVVLLWGLIATARSSLPLALLIGSQIAAVLVAPFLQHPMSGGHLPYRTLVSLPAAIAILALFAGEIAPSRLRAFVLVPLALLVAIQFSWISNRQYYAAEWSLARDKFLAAEIISRIQELAPNDGHYTIAVVGGRRRTHGPLIPKVPDSTLGASFFEWDGGNPARIAALLSFLSDRKFSPASPDQTLNAFEMARDMPSWPVPSSVAKHDGVIVIKLSAPNPQQLAPYCQNRATGICAEL